MCLLMCLEDYYRQLESTLLFFYYVTAERKKLKVRHRFCLKNDKIGLPDGRFFARKSDLGLICAFSAHFCC